MICYHSHFQNMASLPILVYLRNQVQFNHLLIYELHLPLNRFIQTLHHYRSSVLLTLLFQMYIEEL